MVTFSVERDRHVVEVTIHLNGYILRGEEATDDMYASIDLVIEKLEKQIDKYKPNWMKLRNQSLRDLVAEGVPAAEEEPRVPRTKTLCHQAHGCGRSHHADEYARSQFFLFFQCGNGRSECGLPS